VVAGDFNGDGKVDLTAANYGSYDSTSGAYTNSSVSVLLSKGDRTFQGAVNYATGTNPVLIASADFNGDGKHGTGSAARFSWPLAVALDSAGNLYVGDGFNGTLNRGAIRKVTPAGVVTTVADATPFGLAVDKAGTIFAVDEGVVFVEKITADGTLTAVDQLQTGAEAIAAGQGDRLYLVVGYSIQEAVRVDTGWVVTTLAGQPESFGSADGTGSQARFGGYREDGPREPPRGLAVDSDGNVYVADTWNATIRKVTTAGVVTTLGGLAGSGGSADGTGRDARFGGPFGIAVDGEGNVYVADHNNTIRKGRPALAITSSGPDFGFSGGKFGFSLTGPIGELVVVETSGDLLNWRLLWTNTFTRALKFTDPQRSVFSNRFYRAHVK
jgi:hypothetical protein